MPGRIFQQLILQVLPSVPAPSSPLKQGEEVLLRKKKRFSPNSLQICIQTILTILHKFLCRCRVLFSYQPVHDDELELKVFSTQVFCFYDSILGQVFTLSFYVQMFTSLIFVQVDQNLDFMCEVEDGWWKGRLGGRVS